MRKKFEIENEFKRRDAYESNRLVIVGAIKKLLSDTFQRELMAAPGAMDEYKNGLKVKTGWINRPGKLLSKIKAILEGTNIYIEQTAEAKALIKASARTKFDNVKQQPKQDILQYIIYFNKVLNDLQVAFGGTFSSAYTEQDLVIRFIGSLNDKEIYKHFSTGANLGTAGWPKTLEDAKKLVVAQLKLKPMYGTATSDVAFAANDRKSKETKSASYKQVPNM